MSAPIFGPPFPDKRNAAPAKVAASLRENGNNLSPDTTARPALSPSRRGDELRRLRRQRSVERICGLNSGRAWFEFIERLDRTYDLGPALDRELERFAGIDPDILRAVGGDRFPPRPLYIVGGGE